MIRQDSHLRRPWPALVALLVLAAAIPIGVCWYRHDGEGQRYWRGLEDKSGKVAGVFLDAVARGDTVALKAVASDSLVTWLQRHGTPRELLAMSQAGKLFASTPPSVYVYGTGATVTFDYQFGDRSQHGGLEVGIDLDRVVVTEFYTMLRVN